MRPVTLGFLAHSGWAAMVALAGTRRTPEVIARRRVELLSPAHAGWGKHPYHAAAELRPAEAEALVHRAVAGARESARAEVGGAVKALVAQGCEVVGCGLVLGSVMPAWSLGEILAVHARMHQAEGALFREALVLAAEAAGLAVTGVPARKLWEQGVAALGLAEDALRERIAQLGKAVGPPWGRDQKEAALVAWLARRG